MRTWKQMVFAALALTLPTIANAGWFHIHEHNWVTHPAPYAEELARQTVIREDGLIDVIFHVTPSHASKNMAVAAYSAQEQGAVSGPDDTSVMASATSVVEVQKDGIRVGVLLPLFDRSLHTIGTLGLMYRYRSGEDKNAFLKRSEAIRDSLALQIASQASLFEDPRKQSMHGMM